MICDVLVAGAGPAGTIAAKVLAGAGYRVVIADRIAPGWKIGECLPAAGLRLLRDTCPGVVRDFGTVHQKIRGSLSVWHSMELVPQDTLQSPDGPDWRLDRERFDTSLREAAVGAGAVWVAAKLRRLRRNGKRWEIGLDDGASVDVGWLVDASGRSGYVAHQLGVERNRDAALAAVCGFGALLKPGLDRTVIEAVEEGWWHGAVLPDGRALVAAYVLPEAANQVRANWWERLGRTTWMSKLFEAESFCTLEASGGRAAQFYGDGWVLCGDAALWFDPLSSQGIHHALCSGLDAAHALIAGESQAFEAYKTRMEGIRAIYLARLDAAYAAVTRWPEAEFWRSRRGFSAGAGER